MDSALPPLRQLWETADSSLESTPASLHPCSPGRPAQHTSAPVQSHWRGPWASAIPHPLQTLLLIDYSSCNSKRTQCEHFMWVVSRPCAQQTEKEAPGWGLCCCTMFLQTTMQKCSSLMRSWSSLAISLLCLAPNRATSEFLATLPGQKREKVMKDFSTTRNMTLSVKICAMLAYFGVMAFVSCFRAMAMSIGVWKCGSLCGFCQGQCHSPAVPWPGMPCCKGNMLNRERIFMGALREKNRVNSGERRQMHRCLPYNCNTQWACWQSSLLSQAQRWTQVHLQVGESMSRALA